LEDELPHPYGPLQEELWPLSEVDEPVPGVISGLVPGGPVGDEPDEDPQSYGLVQGLEPPGAVEEPDPSEELSPPPGVELPPLLLDDV
jgi:hypothetical protein